MSNNRLKKIFQKKSKNLLSIYITAGYPKIDAMPKLAGVLARGGVDFIEAGMPYSDPLADGPTIQHSSSVALQNGIHLDLYFQQIKQIKEETDLPLVFMGYFNQILKTGIQNFLEKSTDAGIDALIIPDLTPEIYLAKYQSVFEAYNLPLVFLISPTTPLERIQLIDKISKAFIYVVSSSATTGKKGQFGSQEKAYFQRIAGLDLKNPTMIGFGIDSAEKYQMACKYANGAIIGSAFIKSLHGEDYLKNAETFIEKVKKV